MVGLNHRETLWEHRLGVHQGCLALRPHLPVMLVEGSKFDDSVCSGRTGAEWKESSGFTSLSEILGIKVHCPEVPQGLSLDRG